MKKKQSFFKVTGKRFNKRKVIEVEAESIQEAEVEALNQLDSVITVKKSGSSQSFFERGMNIEERNTFLHTIATLSASLSMDVALKEMINHFKGTIKKAASLLLRKIESGKEPDTALEEIGEPHFPSTVVAMIKAGMSAGNMSDAFREAAEFEQEMLKIKKESGHGVLFSMLGFLFAAFVILVTQFWFVPYMMEGDMAFLMKNVDLSWVDPIAWSTTISMLVLVILFFILIFIATVGKKIFPIIADNIILKIPLYKDLVLAKKNYIVVFQLGRLLEKGVPVRNALSRTVENMDKGKMKKDFENALDNLNSGKQWSDALTTFSAMDKAALRASNDQFKAARTLKELSEQYKASYRKIVGAVNIAFFFIAIVYLSLAILILFLYTTLPIFDLINNGMSV